MNRKEFIKYAGIGAFALGIYPTLCCTGPRNRKELANPSLEASEDFDPDLEVELTARPDEIQIFPGEPTWVYTYRSEVTSGNPAQVTTIDGSYAGPVFRVRRGQKVRIYFHNQLPDESIIHWHGLHLPPEMDGHPRYAVGNNGTYVYELEIVDPAGTYWFHPHPHGITGVQVYRGLAGLFIVTDQEEEELNLPAGEFDLPLIIQDRVFDHNNQLQYLEHGMMDRMVGFFGDTILINGKSEAKQVAANAYRLRVINGSNARIYKLAWSDQTPIVVIATDGGLINEPVTKPYLLLAPGERVDIWKDFSGYEQGSTVFLKSLAFDDGTRMGPGGRMGPWMMRPQERRGMGRMQHGEMMSDHDREFMIQEFHVSYPGRENFTLPATLHGPDVIDPEDAINRNDPRRFYFFHSHGNWVVNGRTFEMTDVADDEIVRLDTTELWEFINGTQPGAGGMMQGMMQIPHPVHVHGLQFRIIERDASMMDSQVWDSIRDGFVDQGRQDTFLLMPDMRVSIVMEFRNYTGLYLYHCHNLEHHDMGMMRNYMIE